jgi:hypothetical protein
MLTAAKEGTFSASSDPCVFFPLAASEGVPKNSRLGFARKNPALHQGSAWSNSGKALGIEEVVWEICGGSDDGARYYDPSAGRFLSEDRPNSTSNIHGFYQYASNNPLLWTDPTGLTLQGPPPVPVPGGGPGNGWKWNPDPLNPRGGTWGPREPIPGQSQPTASPEGDSHWDVDDGKGGRQRYDPDGNPITPQQAHPRCDNNWWQKYRLPILIGGAVVIGAAAIALAPVTGGQSLWVFAAAP